MNRWIGALAVGALSSSAFAQGIENPEPGEKENILLTGGRRYRLEVAEFGSVAHGTFSKLWVFSDTFPRGLLAEIKKSSLLQESEGELVLDPEGEPEKDSGYIRWTSKAGDQNAGALLWYVNGSTRRELAVSVDLVLDRKLAEGKPAATYTFGELKVTIDPQKPSLSGVRYGDVKLPDDTRERPSVVVESALQVSVTGSLTDASSEAIRTADRLLGGEITNSLSSLWRVAFSNESHHGITLGWLGYEHLQHGLVLTSVGTQQHRTGQDGTGASGSEEAPVGVRYTVNGEKFPLALVRRQLRDDGWPLVLRCTQLVGTSQDGAAVFQPLEFVLTRRAAEKPKN